MKTSVLFIVAVAALSQASPQVFLKSEWQKFKSDHVKTYSSNVEEQLRMNIFVENHKKVAAHNAKYEKGLVTYKLAINKFSDMLPEEFAVKYTGAKFTPETLQAFRKNAAATFLAPANVEVPKSVDWRGEGAVTPVKNQGACGSCWAFSTTGSVEGQHFRKTGKLVSLSEQQLIDCSDKYGNQGCNGGLMVPAFEYIIDNEGIDTEESYPYEAEDGKCRFNPSNIGANITGYNDIEEGDEEDLKSAVATVGPVSVGIYASEKFMAYDSGVFEDEDCHYYGPNHAVLVVGYGTTDKGRDYWLVKNSWGKDWGDNGYVKMVRNKNNSCHIASVASYPTMK
ncbi:hypothetical protein QAD02_006790 [Eretmocerus hayati]|uniref:Uncharacterized protein n=1 Tax=Eretmocerus hayati TaxID=131215 RepID=A0ACC2N2C4_9HYME|nr:hypothetical protein QAD02_006790 [Eretmocerus hayati]